MLETIKTNGKMNGKNLNICKRLIKRFGRQASIDKLQEETLELSLALLQLKCPTKTNKKRRLDDVYKELADVKIEMRKAEMLFSKKRINKIVNEKLKQKANKYL